MSEGAHQSERWLSHYEKAWKFRHNNIQKFIENDGLNSYQAIEKLERLEQLNQVVGFPFGMMFQKINFPVPPEQLLPTGAPALKPVQILERSVPASFYQGPVDLIMDWLSMNPVKAIVELGAGFGQNLVKMIYRYGPLQAQIYAGEYTQSGQDLAKFLFEKIPGFSAKVFHFDHKAPDISVVQESQDILIFSCHSIEQVTKIPDDYFERLTQGKERVHGLFFEPFGFQISSPSMTPGDVSKQHEAQAKEREWNLNFAQVLLKAQERGTIKIHCMFKNLMPGDAFNPTSFVYWTKS